MHSFLIDVYTVKGGFSYGPGAECNDLSARQVLANQPLILLNFYGEQFSTEVESIPWHRW